MLTTRQRTTAACFVTAACLALGACSGSSDGSGSGGDSAGDRVAGAATGGADSPSAPAASPTSATDKDAPVFDFPSDLKVTIEPAKTGDAAKDALLRDVGYAVKARLEAYTMGSADTPNVRRYYTGLTSSSMGADITRLHNQGQTLTGTYAYYQFQVNDLNKNSAAARYCESQRNAFGKEIKTGKVLHTAPSKTDFVQTTLQAQKNSKGDWQVTTYQRQRAAAPCVRG